MWPCDHVTINSSSLSQFLSHLKHQRLSPLLLKASEVRGGRTAATTCNTQTHLLHTRLTSHNYTGTLENTCFARSQRPLTCNIQLILRLKWMFMWHVKKLPRGGPDILGDCRLSIRGLAVQSPPWSMCPWARRDEELQLHQHFDNSWSALHSLSNIIMARITGL